jgi:hypothetical protein
MNWTNFVIIFKNHVSVQDYKTTYSRLRGKYPTIFSTNRDFDRHSILDSRLFSKSTNLRVLD